jgi:hypothetical protein
MSAHTGIPQACSCNILTIIHMNTPHTYIHTYIHVFMYMHGYTYSKLLGILILVGVLVKVALRYTHTWLISYWWLLMWAEDSHFAPKSFSFVHLCMRGTPVWSMMQCERRCAAGAYAASNDEDESSEVEVDEEPPDFTQCIVFSWLSLWAVFDKVASMHGAQALRKTPRRELLVERLSSHERHRHTSIT